MQKIFAVSVLAATGSAITISSEGQNIEDLGHNSCLDALWWFAESGPWYKWNATKRRCECWGYAKHRDRTKKLDDLPWYFQKELWCPL